MKTPNVKSHSCYFCEKKLTEVLDNEMLFCSEDHFYLLSEVYVRGVNYNEEYKSICIDCFNLELECLVEAISVMYYDDRITLDETNINRKCFSCRKPWTEWRIRRMELSVMHSINAETEDIIDARVGLFCQICSVDTFGIK